VLAIGPLTVTSGLLLVNLPLPQTSTYATVFFCLHNHLSQQRFLFFPVHNPCRLVISFIVFIRIVYCLKLYVNVTCTQMGFVFFLRMFQDKCNRDCNRDYFQCNRNRLHFFLFIHNRNRACDKYVILIHYICDVIAPRLVVAA